MNVRHSVSPSYLQRPASQRQPQRNTDGEVQRDQVGEKLVPDFPLDDVRGVVKPALVSGAVDALAGRSSITVSSSGTAVERRCLAPGRVADIA